LGAVLSFLDRLRGRRPNDAFKPADSAVAFEDFVLDAGGDLGDLSLSRAVELMLGFYESVRAVGCSLDDDGDMLLYQWGTYDWGDGPSFQVDITRQFISAEDDDAVSQLSLVLHFSPTAALDALDAGNRWCESPEQLEDFANFIRASEPYLALEGSRPDPVAFEWSEV